MRPAGKNCLEISLNRLRGQTPSLTMNGSKDVPVSYPKAERRRCRQRRKTCKSG